MNTIQALRLALRRLIRSRAYTAVAALCLALGLGGVIAVLAIVDGLVLKPLPGVERPNELVTLELEGPASVPNLRDIEAQETPLSSIGGLASDLATIRNGSVVDRVLAASVTADYFATLGTRPALGRFFSREEDGPPGAHALGVVSHDYWQRRLDGAPEALGRTLRVNGTAVSVVGVAPPGFIGTFRGFPVDVWLSLSMADVIAPGFDASDRSAAHLELFARLSDGATLASARASLGVLAGRLRATYPEANRDLRIRVLEHTGFDEEIRAPVLSLSAVLLAIAGLVLVIACMNFTNMLLARSTERTKDAAVRMALGVERVDLAASLMAENVVLALIGAGGGLAIARALVASLSGFLDVLPVRVDLDLGLDWRVGAASLALALVVAVATSLVPAGRVSRRDLVSALKGSLEDGAGRWRLRRLLLGGQLAGSTALLVVAGLFLRTVDRVAAVDPGFAIGELSVVPFIDASLLGMQDTEIVRFYERTVQEVRGVSGVVEAAVASSVPLAFGGSSRTRVQIPGLEPPAEESGFETSVVVVSPEYPRTLGIPLVGGRELTSADRASEAPVALVSQAMADRFWPGGAALGRRFRFGSADIEVVGILGDVAEGLDGTPGVTFYLPQAQRPRAGMNLFVRTARGSATASGGVRETLGRLSPDLPGVEPQPLEDFLLLTLLPQRVAGRLGAALGAAALLLAALGVYGLVALSVVQRRHELGIRIAVGAGRGDVLILVLRDVLSLAAWGAGAGLALGFGAGQLVEGLLVGVSPASPAPFVTAALLVVGCAALATLGPARRAASADPLVALTRP